MANINLIDTQTRTNFFKQTVLVNLQYWQAWLETNIADIMALDRVRNAIIRAISLGLDLEDDGWTLVCQLIKIFSPYMERRGYWDIWNGVLRRSIEAAQGVEDVVGEVSLTALLARLLFQQSRFQDSTFSYRRTIWLARRTGDRFNEARACTNLGFYFIEQGYWYRAEVLCCRALKLFEQIDSSHGRAHTENHLGILYTRQNRWDQAQQHLEQACMIWQTMEDEHGLMRGLINLAGVHVRMEQSDKALDYLEKALSKAKLMGDESATATIYMNMGIAHRLRGDLIQAEAWSCKAETIFRRLSNSMELARVWNNLGAIYLRQSKWPEALLHLEKSLEVWRSQGNKPGQADVLVDIIECERARGNRSRALARLQEVEYLLGQDAKKGQYHHLQVRLARIRHSLTQ